MRSWCGGAGPLCSGEALWLAMSSNGLLRTFEQLNSWMRRRVPLRVASFVFLHFFVSRCNNGSTASDINHAIEWRNGWILLPRWHEKIVFVVIMSEEKLRENSASCHTWLAPAISLRTTIYSSHELVSPPSARFSLFYLCSLKHIIVKFMFRSRH